ncbi:MAG: hypothetical protein P8185_20175 [Deltaproteobacteria bacterium]
MYLPKVYEKFTSRFPEVFKDFQQLGKTCRESGPLDKKYQDLANLGIAIGANASGYVNFNIYHKVGFSVQVPGFREQKTEVR